MSGPDEDPRCRQIDAANCRGDGGRLSDDEIARLQHDLYVMAEVALDVCQQRSRSRGVSVDAAAYDRYTDDGDQGWRYRRSRRDWSPISSAHCSSDKA